jgi:hypothetical protein
VIVGVAEQPPTPVKYKKVLTAVGGGIDCLGTMIVVTCAWTDPGIVAKAIPLYNGSAQSIAHIQPTVSIYRPIPTEMAAFEPIKI